MYYVHPSGEVFWYDTEEEREAWGAPELRPMTPAEVEAHLQPQEPQP